MSGREAAEQMHDESETVPIARCDRMAWVRFQLGCQSEWM